MTNRLVICDTCAKLGDTAKGPQWAEALKAQIADQDIPFEVTTTSCMNMCAQPTSFALQAPDKATYLFANANPDTDSDDLLSLLRLYAQSKDGWITDARSIGRLRGCLVGRVPGLKT